MKTEAQNLAIEITRSAPGEWRVVERGQAAAERVFRVSFDQAELAELLGEIKHSLLVANSGTDDQGDRLRFLGRRLAEMTLPLELIEAVAAARDAMEFFLDDASTALPVELFPNGGTVLAEAVPVSRHWFCEGAPSPRRSEGGTARVLIVADPAANLPGARAEGETLYRALRSSPNNPRLRFVGRAITTAALARELPGVDILHLAGHYVAAGSATGAGGLVLADGLWLPHEASQAPELVFANCCRAGLPTDVDGGLSLIGHFMRLGAGHGIAPFLPASDAVGARFAMAFYQSFLAGEAVAAAVWRARKAVGPAAWMYWHFGARPAQCMRPMRPKQSVRKKAALLALVGVVAVLGAWCWFRAGRDRPEAKATASATATENGNRDAPETHGRTRIAPDAHRAF